MQNLYRGALDELGAVMDRLDDSAVDSACAMIASADKIALYGCGREGLQMRGFCMRLFHLGRKVTMVFDMTTPLNNPTKKSLSGIELNFQHTFSNGFGASINFTRVRSGLKYKNGTVGDQTGTALVGLGDSGNIVGFYENEAFSARVAYNWRGKYLSNNYSGSEGAQPLYTEAYGQMDVALGYSVNKNLSLQFEVINLGDKYTRTHMRDELQIGGATQLGRRMMVGARYKF